MSPTLKFQLVLCHVFLDPNVAGMRLFRFLADFRFFSFQIIISKDVGFDLKVSKAQFWTGGVGGFRLFMACFRFFHAELSLMPDVGKYSCNHRFQKYFTCSCPCLQRFLGLNIVVSTDSGVNTTNLTK